MARAHFVHGRARRFACALAPLLLITACDGQGGSSGPGAVSEGEARALDDAAEMLEERRLPEGVLPPAAPEQTPATQGAPATQGDTQEATDDT